MNMELTRTGGTRKCHQCNIRIPKNTLIFIRGTGKDFGVGYENYCPGCAITYLKKTIRIMVKMLNKMDKYMGWDK